MTSTEAQDEQAAPAKMPDKEECPADEVGQPGDENSGTMAPSKTDSRQKPLQDSQNLAQPGPDKQAPQAAARIAPLSSPSSGLASSVGPAAAPPRISAEQQLIKAKRDLESMVIRYAKSESDNLQNKQKLEEMERKLKRAIKDNDSLANRVKILTNDKNHLSDTLSAKVAQLTVLEQKNCSVNSDQRTRMGELEDKAAEFERANEELRKQIDIYKSKEADLLDFSERLSMKQLLLQTELDKAREEVPDYKVQYERLVAQNNELAGRVDELTEQLALAESNLELERRRNGSLNEERRQTELKCRRQIEELENEIKLVRRKCQIATKELLRRIKQYEPDCNG